MAPDGVATVRLRYRNGDVITAPVAGNVFDFTPPQRPIKKLEALRRRFGREIRKGASTDGRWNRSPGASRRRAPGWCPRRSNGLPETVSKCVCCIPPSAAAAGDSILREPVETS